MEDGRWRRGEGVLRLLPLLALFSPSLSLKCFCTDDHCEPYGACEGAVCLVGILKDSNMVIRTCGNRPIGCFRNEGDRWSDLCSCEEPYCNTFSYLRQNAMKDKDGYGGAPSPVPYGSFDSRNIHHDVDPSDSLIFDRVDRPDDSVMPPSNAPLSTRTSFLTLLLVVVPLTVGAATVLVLSPLPHPLHPPFQVVAFNYYCHLC